jgi:UDP-N-acetylglucosamine--N-acetylmuramyl-(pentapeptide) pyrophosphoryl-undecaprenol N-acetylglucosamine transferase
MKILLAGGGSGGSVTPILAVVQQIRKLSAKGGSASGGRTEFLFVGTRRGPERPMVEQAGIKFRTIPAARWRRFFSIKNIWSPFVFVAAFVSAWRIVAQFRPDVVFSTGSFVAVPVSWTGKLFGAKIVIHQQDALKGLANKLIGPIASEITTAFEPTSKEFSSGSGLIGKLKPATWVGNPVREDLTKKILKIVVSFKLNPNLPILLVLGGATGAAQINNLISEILPRLVKNFQVIHQTGQGKLLTGFSDSNYHPVELFPFDQYAHLLQLADIVVCRAGLSTIAELSNLGKVAVVVPMPYTHQEDNAAILKFTKSAVVMLRSQATPENLFKVLNTIKFDPVLMQQLKSNIIRLMPRDAALKLAEIVIG